MGKLSRLFYVSTRQKLPRLKHHLTNGRPMDVKDEEAELLLSAGLVRDWTEARRLIKTRRRSVLDLFWELSKKRKANWRRRLRTLLIHFVGGYVYDPHAREMKDLDGYEDYSKL
jgi:hypothetical protein